MMTYETKSKLFNHQKDAVAKMLPTRVGGLFMEMGTGKTRTTLELIKIRLAKNKINKVVWFTPVSLKENIKREILKHTDCNSVYVFDNKTDIDNIPPAIFYIVGIESMSSSDRVVLTVNHTIDDNTFVVVDESSFIKGHRSKRTERIIFISSKAKYRLILTGTPISNGIVDLYSQMKFLSPKILGYKSFYSFANNHIEYSEKFKGMILRTKNDEYIAKKIEPYIYQVTKEECLDLPEKIYKSYYFYLDKKSREIYEQTKEELLFSVEELDSYTIFKLFTALQQIVSGFKRFGKGEKRIEKRLSDDRVNLLLEIVEKLKDDKIIIWAKYQSDIDVIAKALSKIGKVATYTGKLNDKKKSKSLDYFRDEANFLVATPSSAGYGNTIVEAHTVIFFNNNFKYSERLQAEDRTHRIGQKEKVLYIDIICANTIDERIEHSLYKKGNVVEEFKRDIEKCKGKSLKKHLLEKL